MLNLQLWSTNKIDLLVKLINIFVCTYYIFYPLNLKF